jgi:cytochrome d ubiquinol oxidase subunit I
MTPVTLDRWQFGVTIVYHFLFVPVTIGLALLVAVMQTLAYRRQDPEWDRLARFFGRLFLINFAVGVVTGIVQEFQFGMNWSQYSVFVGNIFGAPLAIEGLLAFFLESTFLGLWIFGRGRLSPRIHLASIWIVSIGTMLSAFFILAANSWMQHPVGYRLAGGRAVLTSFGAVLANTTLWEAFFHTLAAAFVTGGALVLGVCAWQLLRHRERTGFRRAATLAAGFTAVSVLATMVVGDAQARLMDEQQPMKMAAAEAIYDSANGASFSVLTVGDLSGKPIYQIRIPHLLSIIADMSWNGRVEGINQTQVAEAQRYGPSSYKPVFWITYWSFRVMIGAGILILALTAWALLLARRRRLADWRWFLWLTVAGVVLPFVANTAGWIFTEMGRQPWIVYGLLKTAQSASPTVSTTSVALTLAGFISIYTIVGVVDLVLMTRFARRPLGDEAAEEHAHEEPEAGLVY